MNELEFSFANASYLALFLHRVVNRFFTALSVLHEPYHKEMLSEFAAKLNCNKKTRQFYTCLTPPLLFLSIYFQIFSVPVDQVNLLDIGASNDVGMLKSLNTY